MWRRKLEQTRLAQGWRLILPLLAIVLIVVIGGALLFASHVFERNRQEQQLISDALWAEQAVSYEVQRMLDGLRSLGRSGDERRSGNPEWRTGIRSIMQRDPAIVSSYRVSEQSDRIEEYRSSGQAPIAVDRIRAAALRASRLRGPTCLDVSDHPAGAQEVLIALPDESDGSGEIIVAVVSLERLLQNAIPWWLAHNTRITLENAAGDVLAERDSNVPGAGVYVRKIATPFIDRMLYLNADSSRGTPLLIPNILGLSVACLSALLAWTVYALWRDLAKRTKAEIALRAQQALRTAMENSLVTGLRARDLNGRVTYANSAFCEMVGYTLDEIRAMEPPMKYWDPAVKAEAQARHNTLLAGVAIEQPYESKFVKPNGDTVSVLMHEAPLLDGAGAQIGWMASVQNISEQKRNSELLREQAARIQKMSRLMTMGEMASALAHELNQPLSAATSFISAGLNIAADPAEERDLGRALEYFEKAKVQTYRAGEIIRRVRQFVGQSAPTLAPLNLRDIVVELLPLIKLQASDANGRISTSLGDDLPPVLADRILIEQIILNLTKNAFEAMANIDATRRHVHIFFEAEGPAGNVTVGVRDHGPGLDGTSDLALSRSFVTTKPDGLGMGLAVCRSALELLGSKLSYRPASEEGAEFRFVLRAASR
jgi:two-component system sensor histidine kinase DctS